MDHDVLVVLPSTSMMMLQFVVVVFGVVRLVDLDATVGPCQQFASVVKLHQSMVDHCGFEYEPIGTCKWWNAVKNSVVVVF